jgi:hypothetical protein
LPFSVGSRRLPGYDDDHEFDLGDDASTIKIEMQPLGNGDLSRKSSQKCTLVAMPITSLGIPTTLAEEEPKDEQASFNTGNTVAR